MEESILAEQLDIPAFLALKRDGHFVVQRHGAGYRIRVNAPDTPPYAITAKNEAEANRLRLALSDAGMTGHWPKAVNIG